MSRKVKTPNKPAKRGAATAARRNSAKSQQREIEERLASIKAAGFLTLIDVDDVPRLKLRRR